MHEDAHGLTFNGSATIYQLHNLRWKMHNTTFKINKGRFNRLGLKKMTFFQTAEALPLRKNPPKRSAVTCFSVVKSLQMVLHSLQ